MLPLKLTFLLLLIELRNSVSISQEEELDELGLEIVNGTDGVYQGSSSNWSVLETQEPLRNHTQNISALYRGNWFGIHFDKETYADSGRIIFRILDIKSKLPNFHYIKGQLVIKDSVESDSKRFILKGVFFPLSGTLYLISNDNIALIGSMIKKELLQTNQTASISAYINETERMLKLYTSDFETSTVSKDQQTKDPKHRHWSECDLTASLHLHKLEHVSHSTRFIIDSATNLTSYHPASKGWQQTMTESDKVFTDVGVEGDFKSKNCGFVMQITAGQINEGAYYSKGKRYATLQWVCSCGLVFCILYQMKLSLRSVARLQQLSIMTIGMQAVLDAHTCLFHLAVGVVVDSLFTMLTLISMSQFVAFAMLEMRFIVLIWKMRHPLAFNQGWERMRQELSVIYARFYAAVLIGLFVMYKLQAYALVIALLSYSFWIPQIIKNAYSQNACRALSLRYIAGATGFRLFFPLYLFGCPYNFFSLGGNSTVAVALLFWVFAQVTILIGQYRWKGSFFIPKIFLPAQYSYHRPIPLQRIHVSGSGNEEEEVLCAICLLELNCSTHGDVMVTPCDHVFHTDCLTQWMDQKMECPTCRFSPLPEISY